MAGYRNIIRFNYTNSKVEFFTILAKTSFKKFDLNYYSAIKEELLQVQEENKSDKPTTSRASEKKKSSYDNEYELYKDREALILIKKRENPNDPVLRYLPLEDSFDALITIHLMVGHNNTNEFLKLVKEKYAVPECYVDFILIACNVCCNKKKKEERERKSKQELNVPNDNKQEQKDDHDNVSTDQYNKDVRVEICDMTLYRIDGNFKFLLIYVDINTSFTLLRPLLLRCVQEIATEMLNIFSGFGPPKNLYVHDNDQYLFNEVLSFIYNNFCPESSMPDIKIFQMNLNSSVILNMLSSWMLSTGHKNWGIACHLFQWHLNNTVKGIYISKLCSVERRSNVARKTPYSSVFQNSIPLQTDVQKESVKRKRKRTDIVMWDDINAKKNEQENVSEDDINEWYKGKPAVVESYDITIIEEDDDDSNNICCVCDRQILKIATCQQCRRNIHAFCGEKPKHYENSKLLCFLCCKKQASLPL
ncbi:SCAN domain-containing protein 3-like isoform X2 [Ostrinia furnacalis]|uniref:SCAN domain-containing protein 3-like isoform X2 n=1 Tax=Ostrinia furnacalis TaxID=93504 RepID=UPI00103ECFE2|nr:SCAN domain-containing protein 3-like isoform X2 [Ostrinia furnacalis]